MKTQHPVLAILHLLLGALLAGAFLFLVPWHIVPVSLVALLLGLGALGAGITLWRNEDLGKKLARILAKTAMAVGILAILLIINAAVFMAGIYGSLGTTAAGLFAFLGFFFALLLLLLPGIELYFLKQQDN